MDSPEFKSDKYKEFFERLKADNNLLPDIKLVDGLVYSRMDHVTGDCLHDQFVWELWIPEGLVQSVLKNAQ